MTFFVPKSCHGKYLREFIRNDCDVSHGLLVKLKKIPGGIKLNGEDVTVRAVVSGNDKVDLKIEDSENDINPNVPPIGMLPDILYEDESVLAVNKPSGMPTHTSYGHQDDSLSNSVCLYFRNAEKPFVFRAINRLDKDTSGVVIIAKNAFYATKLSKSLESGNFEKIYIALLNGRTDDEGEISGYIKREEKSIIKRSFSKEFSKDGDYSLTNYVKISESNGISMVKIKLETGRTHQIRVHFASINAPVLGDTMYGSFSNEIGRQALHAYKITFPSPINGEKITVTAPIAKDILNVILKNGMLLPEI